MFPTARFVALGLTLALISVPAAAGPEDFTLRLKDGQEVKARLRLREDGVIELVPVTPVSIDGIHEMRCGAPDPLVDITAEAKPLAALALDLAKTHNLSVLVRESVAAFPVTLNLRKTPARTAFELLARIAGSDLIHKDGLFIIGARSPELSDFSAKSENNDGKPIQFQGVTTGEAVKALIREGEDFVAPASIRVEQLSGLIQPTHRVYALEAIAKWSGLGFEHAGRRVAFVAKSAPDDWKGRFAVSLATTFVSDFIADSTNAINKYADDFDGKKAIVMTHVKDIEVPAGWSKLAAEDVTESKAFSGKICMLNGETADSSQYQEIRGERLTNPAIRYGLNDFLSEKDLDECYLVTIAIRLDHGFSTRFKKLKVVVKGKQIVALALGFPTQE